MAPRPSRAKAAAPTLRPAEAGAPFAGRRLRVAHVIHGLQLGGLETLVVRLADTARTQGIEPLVLALGDDGPVRDLLAERGIPLVWLEGLAGLAPATLSRLGQELRAFGAHVVHGHDVGPWLNATAAALLSRGTVPVGTFHQTARPDGKLKVLASAAARLAPALVACGRQVEAEIRAWAPARARVLTIDNGVPLRAPATSVERRALRTRLGLPARALVFGYLGRLHPEKGLETLVGAFAQAFAHRPDVHLVLVGSGPLEGTLRARAVPRVHLLGEVPHGASLLPAFDAYVQPSLREGRSLSLLEAMAAGLPTVTSAIPAIQEVHTEGETALLVRPGDVGALSRALRHLADDATARAAMGARARKRAQTHSVESMAQRYAELYRDVVSRSEA